MSYFDKIQKLIKLPSGAEVIVRRQTKLESILVGQPPAFFLKHHKLRERGQPEPETTPEQDQALLEFIAKQTRVLLTRCCGPLEMDGKTLKIADADPDKTGEGEISWALITDEDASAIIGKINDLSGLGTTGREAVKTFPEKSPAAEGTGRSGETLRVLADGPAEAVAG